MVGQHVLARPRSGNIGNQTKKHKLLNGYGEQLLVEFPELEDLQVSLVAGAGFEPAAFRL